MHFVSTSLVVNRRQRQIGFTLLEILVVVSILGILLGLAAPSVRDAMRKSEARTLSNDFSSALSFARSEAMAKNRCVSMCMTNNPSVAAPTCRTAGEFWHLGWIIFSNPLCDGNPNGTNAELLQVHMGTTTPGPTILQAAGSGTVRTINFDSRGLTTIGQTRAWSIAPVGGNATSLVCLAYSGRVNRYSSATIGTSCSN
jgi:type IV fimbrial biogenesis protein FimT